MTVLGRSYSDDRAPSRHTTLGPPPPRFDVSPEQREAFRARQQEYVERALRIQREQRAAVRERSS